MSDRERVVGKSHEMPREVGPEGIIEAAVDDFSVGIETQWIGLDLGSVRPCSAKLI